MKPLGFQYMIGFGYEDCGDIQNYGSPSHKSRIQSKNGERKNSFRNVQNKAKARRIWKRKDKIEALKSIKLV